ncbi:MAG: restriction endonuclease [Gammaproteobacteria bacterium]|jgi:restriction system protein|nr:restriction endonuclease [Gammaproteobacteria bacterium]
MMSKGPQFIRFMHPILVSLKEKGGSATSSETADDVIERLAISDQELEVTLKSGQTRVYNQIHWARMYLVKAGFIDSSSRGVWTLTETALNQDLAAFNAYEAFKSVQANMKHGGNKMSREIAIKDEAAVEKLLDNAETQLLPVLQTLSAAGFERLCQRLLREHGFKQVKVTGRSGDGGIDGEGVLEINPLLSFKVMFQCKRYKGSVGSPMIRDFRGAMVGKADKGIRITTGNFSMDAKREAVRDGANPIELVDGEKLVAMFETLQLGLKPRTVYEIDFDFFRDYQ